jgi:mannose-1-phosphate guanylyltransferase
VQPESIDYSILEKARNVYTIKADFKWNDLGSWQSLFSILAKNKEQNYHEGDVISLQSKNNLVISPNRLTAVVGVTDMAIINTDDATLIVSHEQSEAVKDVVNMLKSINRKEYL